MYLKPIGALFLFFMTTMVGFSSPAWPQCTSCADCPPPVIGFTSKQMNVKEIQDLTVGGGRGPYTWYIEKGGGSLSAATGTSVMFTAPASNPYCGNNPRIQVTDACGKSAMLPLAVNGFFSGEGAYTVTSCGGLCTHLWFTMYHCNDSPSYVWGQCDACSWSPCGPGNSGVCTLEYDNSCLAPPCSCEGLVERCKKDNPWNCATNGFCDLGIRDLRTAEILAAGCCPASLLPCLGIDPIQVDKPRINLSAGERVNLKASLSPDPGGQVNWKITLAGRVLSRSGEASWDGKDAWGKQVDPGVYIANVEVESSGGSCNGSDSRSIPITVTATQEGEACPDLSVAF